MLRHGRLVFAEAAGDFRSILERKLTNIKKTGAPLVVMDCPGCVLQIRGGMDKDGAAIKVEHTAQRLAEELE